MYFRRWRRPDEPCRAARIALEQAGEEAAGAVLGSDAFFPFPDTVEVAAEAG